MWELTLFHQLIESFREEADQPSVIFNADVGCLCADHAFSMHHRKRLTLNRPFGSKTLRHVLGKKPAMQLWLVGQGTTLIKNQFTHWASAPDSREVLLNPRIRMYGIARCESYWTFIACVEKSDRDHRKKV